jgi:polysaccharide export outer membrane protein
MSYSVNTAGAAALMLASGLACAQDAAPLVLSPSFSLSLPVLSQPTPSQPELSQPAPSQPTLSQPVVSQPVVSQPAVSQAVVAQPVVSQAVVAQPAVSQPVVSQAVVAQPAVSQAVVAQPVVSQPVVTQAVVSQPVVSQPVLSQPLPSLPAEYKLSPGDAIKVQVYQNPDLTLEARVSEAGTIGYPLVGSVAIGGLSLSAAERKIANALAAGDFLKQPQVNIVLLQVRGNQVSVLGQVQRPGRFVLETTNVRVSDLLAQAGHVTPQGADMLVLTGTRDGKPFRKAIDIPGLFRAEDTSENVLVQPGDTLYVDKAPTFYIYGEAQRPGTYRIERGMTILQALAQGGGPTQRGSERVRVNRTRTDGTVIQLEPRLTDPVLPGDVLFVKESLF